MSWIRADKSPPPPAGDCRKLVWIVTDDDMAYVGIRAYRHDLGQWTSNGQKEPGKVTHWMDLPGAPEPEERAVVQGVCPNCLTWVPRGFYACNGDGSHEAVSEKKV